MKVLSGLQHKEINSCRGGEEGKPRVGEDWINVPRVVLLAVLSHADKAFKTGCPKRATLLLINSERFWGRFIEDPLNYENSTSLNLPCCSFLAFRICMLLLLPSRPTKKGIGRLFCIEMGTVRKEPPSSHFFQASNPVA